MFQKCMRLFSDMLTWIIWQAEPTCFPISLSVSLYVFSFSLPFTPLYSYTYRKIWISSQNCVFSWNYLCWIIQGSAGFWVSLFVSLCAECFCPFIDFLLFNYIHSLCVGSLCLRLCIWGCGRNAGSCQMGFWWGREQSAEKGSMWSLWALSLPASFCFSFNSALYLWPSWLKFLYLTWVHSNTGRMLHL